MSKYIVQINHPIFSQIQYYEANTKEEAIITALDKSSHGWHTRTIAKLYKLIPSDIQGECRHCKDKIDMNEGSSK